jgi:hypothetical protein
LMWKTYLLENSKKCKLRRVSVVLRLKFAS